MLKLGEEAEVYVMIDIESDGPIPGPNSMLSLGASAFSETGQGLGKFGVNFETLPGAVSSPETAAWWRSVPEAYALARKDPKPPRDAMQSFVAWVGTLPGKPVCVAWPSGYDFLFLYWYCIHFLGECPFGFSALDVRSYVMAQERSRFWDIQVEKMAPLPHVAIEDADIQGHAFIRRIVRAFGR